MIDESALRKRLSRKRNVTALERCLIRTMFESLIASGHIDPTGKSDEELIRECAVLTFKLTAQPEFTGVIDLRSTILDQARLFVKQRDDAFALVFYATWFEHWINNFLTLRHNEFSLTSSQLDLLLHATVELKYLAFPAMLRLPRLASKHVRTIATIAAARNQFVHYKYKSHDMNKPNPLESRWRNEVKRAEPVVRYLKRYEHKHIFKKSKARIRRLVA